MNVFADPTVCPDCRSDIPSDPDRCPTCSLPLRNSTAADLFRTLQHADVLLDQLRNLPVPALTPLQTTTATVPPYPAPAPRRESADRPGLRGSSVPSVLLGLGALCLLAASVIFLAVAWSWLGVGGRTAVLVALTAAAAGAGVWWARRGLRVAGEALTTVALGLLTLDLFGAENSGWFGSLSEGRFAVIIGSSLALGGLGLATAARHRSSTLISPQLISALGILVAYAGLRDSFAADLWISGIAVGVVASLALAARARLTSLSWSLVVVTSVVWVDLLGGGLNAVPTPVTFASLWRGSGWALLAAAGYLAAPSLLPAMRRTAQWWIGAAAVLGTFTLALPAVETSADGVILTSLMVLAVWTGVAGSLPQPWTWSARVPAIAAALPVGTGALILVAESGARLVAPAPPFSATIGTTLTPADTILSAWLLVPAVLLLTALGTLVASDFVAVTRSRAAATASAVTAVSGVLTVSLFAVPIWTVAAALAALAIAVLSVAARRDDQFALPLAIASVPTFVVAMIVARPSAGLLAIIAVCVAAAATQAALNARTSPVEALGHLTLPVGLAIALYTTGEVLGLSETTRAIVVILVLGALAILRPRPDLETPAALCATVIGSIAVTGSDGGAGSLALLLTLGGAVVTVSALLNSDRRLLGWLGGTLLAAATWVRLADIGVGTPEAYTLPSALALIAVGTWRLKQDPTLGTARLLGPGLVLATLPSLLWTLGDPTSPRAVMLGAACLILVLGGTSLRWNAPLLIGAGVGATLVLIEVAPYAALTPQWVLIGLAGATLTAVGVTWESRMQDVRQAGAYLERLR